MDDMRKELFYEQKNGYDLIDAQERLELEITARATWTFSTIPAQSGRR